MTNSVSPTKGMLDARCHTGRMTASSTSMCVVASITLAVVCECPALEAAAERCAVTDPCATGSEKPIVWL